MDINSRTYCNTHHVGRMWNNNPEIIRNSRKGSENVTQFPENVAHDKLHDNKVLWIIW